MKIRAHICELYNASILIIYNTTFKGFINYCKKNGIEVSYYGGSDDIGGFVAKTDGGEYVIFVSDPQDGMLYMHELYHLARAILKDRRVYGEEAHAYYYGHLGGAILERMNARIQMRK